MTELGPASLRLVLSLLHRELGAVPAPADPAAAAWLEFAHRQPWGTCAGCPRRRVRLTYTRAGRRWCPACWQSMTAPATDTGLTPSDRRTA